MPSIINATTTNGVAISPDNSGSLQLATNNGTTAMTITTGQNVGIGTSSPTFAAGGGLNVANSTFATMRARGGSSTGTDFAQASDGKGYVYVRDNADLIVGTNNTERMRIDSSGNVLVNAAAVLANSAGKLQVECSAPSGGSQYGALIGGNGTGYTVYGIRFLNTYTPAIVGSITINSSSTSYNTSSDYRLKEDIAPMTGALAKVQQLNPVTYKWKLDGKDGQGFIAHELQAVVPDAVTGEKDAVDEEGNPVYQGVDTSFLVATLTAAIQEQQAMIETLKTELDTVKAELNTLKNPPVEGTE